MVSLCTGIISESLVTSQQIFKHRKLQSFEEKRKSVGSDLYAFLVEVHEDEKDEFGNVEPEDLKTSVRGDTELLAKLAAIGINLDEAGVLSLVDKISKDGEQKVNLEYFTDKLTNLNGQASASAVVELGHKMNLMHLKIDALAKRMYPDDPLLLGTTKKGGSAEKMSEEQVQQKRTSVRQSQEEKKKKEKKQGKAMFAEEE